MLKIGKGLHKKKKSKKNKHKQEELFTEEELEQYRREHSQKPEESSENSNEKTTSEELQKFKALTAGVDDILRKSQGDLDRIKKDSFFQRKLTPSELKAQEEKEREYLKHTQGNWIDCEGKNQSEEESAKKEEGEGKVAEEDSESEYEFDDKDDIFDTAYVDALESGEIKLVYVPEDDDSIYKSSEPDPFDTTSADEILKKVQEEEEKKRKQISLGLAVHVLTGRAERDKSILQKSGVEGIIHETVAINKTRSRPRKIQEIALIGSFDEQNNQFEPPTSEVSVQNIPKSLLDDDLIVEAALPEGDQLITEVIARQSTRPEEPAEQNTKETNSDSLKDLVGEFDVIKDCVSEEVRKAEVEDQFDEFTALAVSSIVNQKLEESLQKYENLEDDPFDTSTASIVLKEQADPFGNIDSEVPPPQICEFSSTNKKWSAFEEPEEETEVDPFDTSFAEKIQPGKCELKLLERTILGDFKESVPKSDTHQEARILSRNNSETDFDSRIPEIRIINGQSFLSKVSIQITDPSGSVEGRASERELVSLTHKHRDLLGGSTTDLTKLGSHPLPPEIKPPAEDFSDYSDPFDTSIVDKTTLPGKAELKFIEKELLSDIPLEVEDILVDNEFDPRQEETSEKKVTFDIPSPAYSDLLSTKETEGIRPLTPYSFISQTNSESDCEIADPFDTSLITSLPGKEEIKLIEKELESVQINPAVFEPIHRKLKLAEDICISSSGLRGNLPNQDISPSTEKKDFHRANESTVNGRRFSDITGLSKNKFLLNIQPVKKPDLLICEEEFAVKTLTPACEEDISTYIDPFDTSIAENIVPGKAELKVLESELLTETSTREIKRSYTDPDFNPREREKEADRKYYRVPDSDILNLSENSAINVKPLTPTEYDIVIDDEVDPFDTSIAANLLPGKAEIRVLESELFGQ